MNTFKKILLYTAAAGSLLGTTVKEGFSQSNENTKKELILKSNNFLNQNIGGLEQIRDSTNAPINGFIENTINYTSNVKNLAGLIASCDDEKLNEVRDEIQRSYIGSGTLSSREVLTLDDYTVPMTFTGNSADTLRIHEIVNSNDLTHIEYQTEDGWKRARITDDDVELAPGTYLRQTPEGAVIEKTEYAPTNAHSFTLINMDEKEAVRLAYVNINQNNTDQDLVNNYITQINNLNEEAESLAFALADEKDKVSDLETKLSNAPKAKGSFSAYTLATLADGQPTATPGFAYNNGKVSMLAQFTLPTSSYEFDEPQIAEENPRGPKAGEVSVRETTEEETTTNYAFDAGLLFGNSFRIGPNVGLENVNVVNDHVDTSYRIGQGIDGPIKLGLQQDNFREASNTNYLRLGATARKHFDSGLEAYLQANHSLGSGNTYLSIGLGGNINKIAKKLRGKQNE